MFGRKRRRLSDFDGEINSHLDLASEEFREEGLDEREARYAALRQFGNVTIARERFYEARPLHWLERLAAEVREASKSLAKAPRFTIPAVLTLALGLGGALTFYSAFHAVFLRTFPFPHADRIYRLVSHTTSMGTIPWVGFDSALELEKSPDVERVGQMMTVYQAYWIPDSGSSVSIDALPIDAGVQDIAGLRPALGTLFYEDAFTSGEGALVSDRFWRDRLGRDQSVIGRMLNVDNKRTPIVGVLDSRSEVPLSREADVYFPRRWLTSKELNGSNATCLVLARLRDGVRPESLRPQLRAVAEKVERRPGRADRLDFQSLRKAMADDADMRFFVVCGAAALFLLLATANVAGLFLARGAERSWETSVRLCLGAPTTALFRKFFAEGSLVALSSACVAFCVNALLAGSMRAWLPGAASLPGLNGTWDHVGVALFALALVIATTILLGLVPMLQVRRLDLVRTIQEGRRIQSVRTRGRTGLVIVQMMLAMLLLCTTALLARSLWAMVHRPVAFKSENLAMARLLHGGAQKAFEPLPDNGFLPALRTRPGVRSAGWTLGLGGATGTMLLGAGSGSMRIGENGQTMAKMTPVRRVFVSDDVFETLGVPLLSGHDFGEEDRTRDVVVVNRELERLLGLEKGKASGQKLHWGKAVPEVIGVVPAFELFLQVESGVPMVFHSLGRLRPETLFVRSTLTKKDLDLTIASVMRETMPGVSLGSIEIMSEVRGEQSQPHRQVLGLIAAFGGAAILLATMGLSALLSDSVSRRTRELGIRATLGATSKRLIGQIMLQGLWRTGLGVGLGLAAALLLGRYLQSLLYGIRANDAATLVGVGSLLLILGLLSSVVPALRSACIDPAKALREE